MDDGVREFVPPDGGYGWVIVACCVLINSFLMPITQCFGIIYRSKFDDMKITAAQTSTLLHLHNAIWCFLGLFSGPLLKKFNFQQVSMIGGLLVCVGTFLTAFATSYAALIFTVCLLIGIGHGIILPATYMAVYTYFKHRVTLAVTFQITGAALAPIIMPLLCTYLLHEFGTQGTVLVLAGIALNAIPAILLMRPPPRNRSTKNKARPVIVANRASSGDESKDCPDRVHVSEQLINPPPSKPYNETTIPLPTAPSPIDRWRQLCDTFNLELFTSRTYLVCVCGLAISFAAELNIVLMVPFVLGELAQFAMNDVARAMSTHAIADIIGRLVLPLAAHRIGASPKVVYGTALVGSSVGRTIFALFYDFNVAVFFACFLLGLSKGLKAVFQSLIIPKYIPFDKLASANGLLMVVNGVVSMIIGPIIGLTHDLSHSYEVTLHVATLISLTCIVIWSLDHLLKPKISSTNEVNIS